MKKRMLAVAMGLVMILGIATGCSTKETGTGSSENSGEAKSSYVGDKSQEFYMITSVSGLDYWKGCYKGFEDAARILGVKTVYAGPTEPDLNKAVTVMDQIIAKNPAGIAVYCMNEDGFVDVINRAVDAGIPVVTFDSDSPDSKRYTYLSTGNEEAGAAAAHELAEQIGRKGKVGIVTNIGPENMTARVKGFEDVMKAEYPDIEVVQTLNGESDQNTAATQVSSFLQSNPDIAGLYCTYGEMSIGSVTALKDANMSGKVKVVTFDTDQVTLESIKTGEVAATVAQGRYNMGYWSLMKLFAVKNDLVNPVKNWKEVGISPLPDYVDTGVSVITAENVDAIYDAEYGNKQ